MRPDSEPGPLAEPRAWIEALLEGRLTPEDGRRLEQLVCQRKDVRRLYLRYMHLNCSLPPHLALPGSIPDEDAAGVAGEDDDNLDNDPSLVKTLAAFRAVELPEAIDPAGPRSPRVRRLTSRRRIIGAAAALAACVVLGLFLYRNRSVVARVSATAAAQWDPADAVVPGAALQSGRRLRLKGGTVDIDFASGARIVVAGPASFRVDDRNRVALEEGKLTARVPPEARGFIATSSNLVVTDLGTAFELTVSPAGMAELRVLEGTVDAGWQGAASSRPPPTRLTQGQAVTCAVAGGVFRPLATAVPPTPPFPPGISVPSITLPAAPQVRRVIPLHNTGIGLREGDGDSNWGIVAVSYDAAFPQQGAVVTKPAPGGHYLPNDPQHSQWLSLAGNLPRLPPGTYTFKTLIDLSGYDARAVSLRARVAVDDAVQDVRLNGKSTGLTVPYDPKGPTRFFDLLFPGGFVQGVNDVEFVVFNKADVNAEGNPMALRVEWEVTAIPGTTD